VRNLGKQKNLEQKKAGNTVERRAGGKRRLAEVLLDRRASRWGTGRF